MKVKCPKCKFSNAVIPIMYGYPSHEIWEKRDRGEVKLGGCMATDVDPDYHCKKCNYEWNKDNPHYGKYSNSDEEK